MSHDHHHHHHHYESMSRALVAGIVLNVAFVVIEAVAGLWLGSLSLLSDAGHNLSDVVSLVLVLAANKLAQRKATEQFTYGFGKTTILVALVNAVTLLLMVGALAWEAIHRLGEVHTVNGGMVAWVALAGIIVNGVTALFFFKDKEKDLNTQGAYLHMVADALVSVGVLISGVIIFYTQQYWLDAVVSLLIGVVIIAGSWQLFKDSWRLSMDGVPAHVNVEEIKKFLLSVNGVESLHDLHIWAMSTNTTALTVHLVMAQENDTMTWVKHELHNRFHIDHTTIQIERPSAGVCEQKC
ncbi:MAG: cation transporter [Bacteroidetes bacterium]|nr:cation transporter [Bacteroidota bacterium]MBS1541718.1 cation transporter [Bacteroidota bacterium]